MSENLARRNEILSRMDTRVRAVRALWQTVDRLPSLDPFKHGANLLSGVSHAAEAEGLRRSFLSVLPPSAPYTSESPFYNRFRNGVEDLISQRAKLRGILTDLGVNAANVKAYNPYISTDYPEFQDQVVGVRFGKASICLTIRPDAYDAFIGANHPNIKDSLGFHKLGSIFAFRRQDPLQPEKERQQIAAHEDMHVVWEQFRYPGEPGYPATYLFDNVMEIAIAESSNVSDLPDVDQERKRLINHYVRHTFLGFLSTIDKEELGVDIASRRPGSRLPLPANSFARILRDFHDHLSKYLVRLENEFGVGDRTASISQALKLPLQQTDVDKLSADIQSLHDRLIDSKAKERVDDLFIALFLYWPHMSNVRDLVDRWIFDAEVN